MTIFTRTVKGLSNLALFYRVDLIVYTEGGTNQYTLEDICDEKYNKESIDIKFWNVILTTYLTNKKFHFKAVGSKHTAIKICSLIESNHITNSLIAIDSDLDDFFNLKFQSPCILYTQGYSWENDVFSDHIVKKQILSFLLSAEMTPQTEEDIDRYFRIFYRHGLRILKLELIYRKYGTKFITDCAGDKFIEIKSYPRLNIREILRLSFNKKQNLQRPVRLNNQNNSLHSVKFVYGKLQLAIALKIISYVCKKYTNIKSFPKDILIASMIEFYKTHLNANGDIYYETQIKRFSSWHFQSTQQ